MGSNTIYILIIVLVCMAMVYQVGMHRMEQEPELRTRYADKTLDVMRIGSYYVLTWMSTVIFPGGKAGIQLLKHNP